MDCVAILHPLSRKTLPPTIRFFSRCLGEVGMLARFLVLRACFDQFPSRALKEGPPLETEVMTSGRLAV